MSQTHSPIAKDLHSDVDQLKSSFCAEHEVDEIPGVGSLPPFCVETYPQLHYWFHLVDMKVYRGSLVIQDLIRSELGS